MKPSIAVYVETFIHPPTPLFVEALAQIVPANFENCVAHVSSDPESVPEFPDIRDCIAYTLQKTQEQLENKPDCQFAVSVVPMQLDIQIEDNPSKFQSIVLVGVRNDHNEEWVYAQFIGKIVAPEEVARRIREAATSVIEDRGTFCPDADEAKVMRVLTLMNVIVGGVNHVLYRKKGTRTLN